jgi:hypothetical protein
MWESTITASPWRAIFSPAAVAIFLVATVIVLTALAVNRQHPVHTFANGG